MKIICPNFNNEEVAREFEELKNATSEQAAYHIWSLNNGYGLDKAPNGEPSKLFSDLLSKYNGNRAAAIRERALNFSNSVKPSNQEVFKSAMDISEKVAVDATIQRIIDFTGNTERPIMRNGTDLDYDNLFYWIGKFKTAYANIPKYQKLTKSKQFYSKKDAQIGITNITDQVPTDEFRHLARYVAYPYKLKNSDKWGITYVSNATWKAVTEELIKRYNTRQIFQSNNANSEILPDEAFDFTVPFWEDYDTIFSSPVSEITTEATGSDNTLVSRIFSNKNQITAAEAIEALKKNPNVAPMAEVLEKLLTDSLKDVKIFYVPVGANLAGAAAAYHHQSGHIIVYGDASFYAKAESENGPVLADTAIIHELIHAATIEKLKAYPELYAEATQLLESARRQIMEKEGKTLEQLLADRKYYGLTDVYEFFSEAFSNGRFINELRALKAETTATPKGFLKGLFDWIMGILFGSTDANLYQNVMAQLENLLFNVEMPYSGLYANDAYMNSFDDVISRSTTAQTSNPKDIKNILTQNAKHIAFEPSSHTYTNVDTGDIYTPVSTVKDMNGYGADTSTMSDEDLAYGQFAAEVGTQIHEYMAAVLTDDAAAKRASKLSKSAKKMIETSVIPKLLKEGWEVVASEQLIANDASKIAGTLDLLLKDPDGKIHLVDFKTKARTVRGKSKYGFDYYFSAKYETRKGGKPDASRHDYQLTLYKRMLELMGIQVDSKEIVPLEYTVDENGVVTEVWMPDLEYSESNGTIHHRVNNKLEQEINDTVLSADNRAATSEIDSENLLKQSEIVDNILRVLKNQLALYRVKGYTTKAEVLKKFIDKLNSDEETEVMVSYIHQALKFLQPLIDDYNATLEGERQGNSNLWNLRKLEAWKNYAESFANLDDIQNYLFLNPKAFASLNDEDAQALKEALATAIGYKNILENAYKLKGERIWLDWLAPFTTRVEAEYRRDAEREYKKANRCNIDPVAMNKYIDKYVADHRNEINLKSRNLLRDQSRIATSSPVNSFTRWIDTIFESSDTIVGAMARAYHTTWMESLDEFNEMYRQLITLTEELENAYPQFKHNPAKLYDFMIESDETGSRLISRLSPAFEIAYKAAKEEINGNPKYETSKDKAVAISEWLNKNAPINNKTELANKKVAIIKQLLDSGRITQEEYNVLVNNEQRESNFKKSWADMVSRDQITEDTADYLRVKFNQLNWEYRIPDPAKYPNKKWQALEKVRTKNPNDIRVKYYDFILNLSLHGDSLVPERFKLGGRLPGMSKTVAERIVSGNVTSQLWEGIKNEFQLRADDTDKGMQMTDELDRPIKFVPIFFTNTLPASEQSLDVATLYKEWFRSVNNYNYINQILPQLEYTKWVVENRKTAKTDSSGNPVKNVLSRVMSHGDSDVDPSTNALITDENLINQLNTWFDQVVYGVSTNNLGTTFGMDNAKLLALFQKYTSLKIMGVNMVSMVNNALMAEVQQAIEAFARQYVSAESYTAATLAYTQDLPNILGDVGSRKITSLTNLLNEHFGIFVDFNEGSMLDNNKAKKLSKVSTLYFTTNVGEHEAQSRFLIAALKEKRALDRNGNDIGSMYDFFSAEDGKLVFDKDRKVANFSKKEQIAFGQQISAAIRKMHGNYAPYSKVALQQHGAGRLALMFRKWIWSTWKRRLAGEYYDEYGQTFSKGYYRDGGSFYYNKVRGFFGRFVDEAKALEFVEKADWGTMTESEKANVKRFTTEVGVMAMASILSSLIRAIDVDDDDENLKLVLSHIDYQLYRLSIDMTFYVLPSSFLKIVQSPIPSASVIRDVSDLFESILNPLERYEQGDMKGELKLKKRVMDLIPVSRQLYRLRNIDDEKQLLSIL